MVWYGRFNLRGHLVPIPLHPPPGLHPVKNKPGRTSGKNVQLERKLRKSQHDTNGLGIIAKTTLPGSTYCQVKILSIDYAQKRYGLFKKEMKIVL